MLPALIVGGLAAALAFLFARGQLNDLKVPVAATLIVEGAPATVMAIWAHPDDEITCAGTLAAMARDGAQITLVYLTRGEAARDTGFSREDLGSVRVAEAQAAGALLGASHVEVLEFPDGGLSTADGEAAKAVISDQIARWAPSLLISFDERVGYYGHPDHVAVGRWVRQVAHENACVRRLYQVTLPTTLIALALRMVDAFRDNYPKANDRGLPVPTVAVAISGLASTKRRLLDVHASQAKVMADVQPYFDRLPAWLYYRLFDREYFALAFSR